MEGKGKRKPTCPLPSLAICPRFEFNFEVRQRQESFGPGRNGMAWMEGGLCLKCCLHKKMQ